MRLECTKSSAETRYARNPNATVQQIHGVADQRGVNVQKVQLSLFQSAWETGVAQQLHTHDMYVMDGLLYCNPLTRVA